MDSELFPLTKHQLKDCDFPARTKSNTLYFGPKSGYKCSLCGNEYYNIRHLNTHMNHKHNLMQKMMNWIRQEE